MGGVLSVASTTKDLTLTLPINLPVLLFFAFGDLLAFLLFEEFLAFLSGFPCFTKDSRGSTRIQNPLYFG